MLLNDGIANNNIPTVMNLPRNGIPTLTYTQRYSYPNLHATVFLP